MALLVGVRKPGHANRNPVCIEPEDGQWPLALFDGLVGSIDDIYSKHHLQNMIFGDEPSMRDKPEWMHRDSVTTAVRRALMPYDERQGVRSFVGQARPIDRSEEHTSELQSLMRISYAVFCLKKK